MTKIKDFNPDSKNYNFYLDPSLIDLDIVKRIGIEKSSNSLIVEACNQIITTRQLTNR